MPAKQLKWSAEQASALPADGNRYEVLDGDLFVTPAPSWDHQWLVGALYRRLFEHALTHRIGWVFQSPAEIVFSPRRLVQPDLFVVPWGDARPRAGRTRRRWCSPSRSFLRPPRTPTGIASG